MSSNSLAANIPSAVRVYADGASRGNPGPAAAGWVICALDETPLIFGHRALGVHTNNEAEYRAATLGLEAALALGAKNVCLRADSELMVRQLTGRYKVKNARLKPLFDALLALTRRFDAFDVEHVPRARNALADAEANKALDALKQAHRQ